MTTANILSILRGALNYPLEESCYREHIRVHDISFLSSERVFENEEIAGLEIKYSKLTMVPDSTLMIGDIIASGETLIHCLRSVSYTHLGAAVVRGLQGEDLATDHTVASELKHYTGYGNPIGGLNCAPTTMGRHDVFSYCMPVFEEAFVKAGATDTM